MIEKPHYIIFLNGATFDVDFTLNKTQIGRCIIILTCVTVIRRRRRENASATRPGAARTAIGLEMKTVKNHSQRDARAECIRNGNEHDIYICDIIVSRRRVEETRTTIAPPLTLSLSLSPDVRHFIRAQTLHQ